MAEEDKSIITYQTEQGAPMKLSPAIVRRYLAQGKFPPDDVEVVFFMKTCQAYKLNPYLREVHLLKFSQNSPATIVVGKETYNKRAAKHPQYNGMRAGIVVQQAAPLVGVVEREGTLLLKDEILLGGWAETFRKDWGHPVKEIVSLGEYIGLKNDGTPNRQWERMSATMICKVAKVHSWREAFPDILGSLMDQTEVNVEATELNSTPITKYEVDSQAGEESQAKTEEQLELEAGILKKIAHEAFKGKIMFALKEGEEKKEVNLNKYRAKMPDNLAKNNLPVEKLREMDDTVAVLLQASLDHIFAKDDPGSQKKFTPPKNQGQVTEEDVQEQATFDGFGEPNPAEREGNLSNGGGK